MEYIARKGGAALFAFMVLTAFAGAGPAGTSGFPPSFSSWGMTKDAVLGRIIAPGTAVSELSPRANPRYDNKIVNYLLSVNGALADNMTIVQAASTPARDYLFIRSRLMAVMERHGAISTAAFAEKLGAVMNVYGKPHIQHEGSTTSYSFSCEKTIVLVQISKVEGNYECTMHYYARSIFRLLLTE
ncbi:MAG TPA: hypothetical protein VLM75_00090 [Spirochaetota bacterium]|nr:hypothetical protein [Spirochaetota bacterium]